MIRSRRMSESRVLAACAAASTSRVAARLSANAVLSPAAAGSMATAATPAGTLPARNSSRGTRVSALWRL